MEAACAAVTSVRGTVPAGMVYRARAVGELAGKVTLRLRGCYSYCVGSVEKWTPCTPNAEMSDVACVCVRCELRRDARKSDLQCPDMLVFHRIVRSTHHICAAQLSLK